MIVIYVLTSLCTCEFILMQFVGCELLYNKKYVGQVIVAVVLELVLKEPR